MGITRLAHLLSGSQKHGQGGVRVHRPLSAIGSHMPSLKLIKIIQKRPKPMIFMLYSPFLKSNFNWTLFKIKNSVYPHFLSHKRLNVFSQQNFVKNSKLQWSHS